MEVLFYICIFIIWMIVANLTFHRNMSMGVVIIHAIMFIIGIYVVGPLIMAKAHAAEIPKDPIGEFIATLPGIKYPEWGDKDITFPVHCEGSYRTRLNCARAAWDKKHKGN